MIPKIIHYCWLSDEHYPFLVEKCIESWKLLLPEYTFILWNKEQIDIYSNLWLKQAYENRKYAFAADYIRFYALYHYGGIYLDADVEVLKSFTPLLNSEQFIGREVSGDIEAAVMGAAKGLAWVKDCLDYYENRSFIKTNGKFDMRPVPLLVSDVISPKDIVVMPFYYFSPKDYNTGEMMVSNETYCIHHFDGKWIQKGVKYKIKRLLHKLFCLSIGRTGHDKLVKIIRNFK